MRDRTPLEDSEYIIKQSNKITYRWASGIISSNYISILLTKLIKKDTIKDTKTDDIKTLYDTLKNNTKNDKLKQFLTKSYRRFEDSDKTRNRCAHVIEGEPTVHEIKQSISLAILLQRYL
jgi:predicted transcriptional regulator